MFGQNTNQDQQQWQPQADQFGAQPPAASTPAPAADPGLPPAPASDQAFSGFPPPPAAAEPESTPELPPASSAPSTPASGVVSTDDLLAIKQEALQQLSPLVGHLEQTPEEKFRTTMMMIQASDDQSLLQSAYDLAKQITDEKIRAQALLDVVNEINYFTQQHNS